MAIRKGNFMSGKLKNIVFRKQKNVQIMQTKPGKGMVKQTPETIKKAYLFGRASMLGKFTRWSTGNLIFGFHDGPMINRLTKRFQEILLPYYPVKNETHPFTTDGFARLNGFDFNLNSPLHKSLWAEPVITLSGHELKVTLPEINIPVELKFPENCDSCVITISTSAFDLENGYESLHPDYREIKVSQEQQILEKQEFSFQLPHGCLCITGIALQYFFKKHSLTMLYNHKGFNPAQICSAVITAGNFVFEENKGWGRTKWSKAAFDKYATINQASPRSRPSYSPHIYTEQDGIFRF
jgi:hypothetical protein